ncbi:MAG: aminotransferase class I/II-fold pyridoxal phosphate-dependent enzyme, partial [Chloroflexota bacterium]
RYTEENYDKIVRPENVIVSSGAKQSIFNLLYTILNPQDEVILLAPYWVSYPEMIKMCWGVPVVVTPEDGRFEPTLAEVEERVSPSTKAIILNSPNNPSGWLYSEEFVASLVDFCERRDIYLIMDDIYHKLVFDGRVTPSAYKFTTKDLESSKIVVVNGISKLYGMTGFRIGWCVAPKPIVEVMTNVQVQTTSCTSVVLQAAAEGALNGLQGLVESLRMTMENNRNVIVQELKSFSGVKIIEPRGTFYAFPDFRAYNKSSVELASFLLKKAKVVVVPGKEFGLEGHLRLSFAVTIKDITESIARLKWALDPNSPNEIYIGDRKLVRDWM